MSDIVLNSTNLDKNGRKIVKDDSILSVKYYDSSQESWDRTGAGSSSWFRELSVPSDTFDSEEIISNKWLILNNKSGNLVEQGSGTLNLEIHKSEAKAALTSDSLWRLTGDFEARLYMDWGSYYNEYRGISDSYITVGYDKENLARLSFSFNDSGYEFRSLKSLNKDVRFFGWSPNGAVELVDSIGDANDYEYFSVIRTSGVLSFYINNGTIQTQIGDSISDAVFSNDLFVEIGIETSQFNTYKHNISKVFFTGNIEPPTEFFSENRGPRKDFPDKTILTMDSDSLSIIDESDYTLWARFLLGEGGAIPDSNTRVSASNGSIFCATASGVLAIDFKDDSIYRYVNSGRQVSSEPISMRNSSMSYSIDDATTGTLPVNSFQDISSQFIDGQNYVAVTSPTHTVILKHLASGIAYTEDGQGSLSKVLLTPAGTLYWSGYDSVTNTGQLSYKESLTSLLTSTGQTVFSRDGYYGTDTFINILGETITAFDVLHLSGIDLLAVGSTEGLTFIGKSPVADFTGSRTYGVESIESNPFSDPSFQQHIGKFWKPIINDFHRGKFATVSTEFPGNGQKSLKLYMAEPPENSHYEDGTYVGVKQDVDLTGVSYVYFDSRFESGGSFSTNYWNLEVVVGSDIVKSISDSGPSFTRLNDSFDVSGYSGINTVTFRIKNVQDYPSNLGIISQRIIYIDNIRTFVGSPDFRILKASDISVSEVLLQFDTGGHKIYYSTPGGYGAVDLYSNSLDFFQPITGILPGEQVQSADFSRDDSEI